MVEVTSLQMPIVPNRGEHEDEHELIRAAQAREPHAFEALMRRYNRRLFRTARSVLRDDSAAEDAVQEAYVKAFLHLDRYRPTGSFGAWLTRLALNEALMLRRRMRRNEVPLDSIELDEREHALDQWLSTPDTSHATAARQLLEQAIDSLPQAFRTVFVLRVVEQLSVAETAASLDIAKATVKTRLHRAQARLRTDISRRLRREHLSLFEFGGTRCDRIVAGVHARLAQASDRAALDLLL